MKNMIMTVIAFTIMCLPSCVSLLPVNNQYEKAGTLQQGHTEGMAMAVLRTVTVTMGSGQVMVLPTDLT